MCSIFMAAILTHAKAHPATELADGFDIKAWSDFKPMEGFVAWETIFGAASGKGTVRVTK